MDSRLNAGNTWSETRNTKTIKKYMYAEKKTKQIDRESFNIFT